MELVVNVIDHGMSIQDAIDAPRFHHQWLPDTVLAEPQCFAPDVRAALESMGHVIRAGGQQGSVMAIRVHSGGAPTGGTYLEAGVDRRRPDCAAAGE